MFAVLGQMAEAHPSFPHWYLPWLGVDPAQQGRGLGTQLSVTAGSVTGREATQEFLRCVESSSFIDPVPQAAAARH